MGIESATFDIKFSERYLREVQDVFLVCGGRLVSSIEGRDNFEFRGAYGVIEGSLATRGRGTARFVALRVTLCNPPSADQFLIEILERVLEASNGGVCRDAQRRKQFSAIELNRDELLGGIEGKRATFREYYGERVLHLSSDEFWLMEKNGEWRAVTSQ